jgi:hypothetical protein
MKYLILLLLLLPTVAFAVIPKNKLCKVADGSLRLTLYRPQPFGYTEEVYFINSMRLNYVNFQFLDSLGNVVMSNQMPIGGIDQETKIDETTTEVSNLNAFPSMSSHPAQPIEPVSNLPQVQQALRREVELSLPMAMEFSRRFASFQNCPTLERQVQLNNMIRYHQSTPTTPQVSAQPVPALLPEPPRIVNDRRIQTAPAVQHYDNQIEYDPMAPLSPLNRLSDLDSMDFGIPNFYNQGKPGSGGGF